MDNKLDRFFKEIDGKDRIIGKEKKLNYSVMVLFCKIEDEINILFEKRAMNIAQGGEISFPGGKIEKEDPSCIETALRETFEEIGIKKERIINVTHYGKLLIPTGQLIDVQFGVVENFCYEELKLNPDEVEKIFLVPLKFFLETEPRIEKVMVENRPKYLKGNEEKNFPVEELGIPHRYEKPWGREREIYFYNYAGEVIWGITGEIIYSVAKDMKKNV